MIEFNYTLLVQFFQLLVVLILLDVFLFRPIVSHLSDRQTKVRSLARSAEEKREEAQGLAKAYEEDLKAKRLPITSGKESALKEAHAASMKVVEEARRKLASELARVKDEVEKESAGTLSALVADSDRLAGKIAARITGRA